MGRTGHEFTPEQEKAIGELVCDNWGADFQTGKFKVDGGEALTIWWRRSPSDPVRNAVVKPDGTVIFNDGT